MASQKLLFLAAAILSASVIPASAQTITEFPLPTPGSTPGSITAGPDGSLWFTEHTYDSTTGVFTRAAIGRITTAGSITEFPLPMPAATPVGIVAGPDGNLWITQADADFGLGAITRLTLAGAVTQFAWDGYPWDIAVGSDGNLWFTEAEPTNKIGRITTAGVRTSFPISSGGYSLGIASGPDGNLWFTQLGPGRVGRMTPSGGLTQFPLPTPLSPPGDIAAGPDGNLWFTESLGNKIGRITPLGVITEFSIPTRDSGPNGITAGPDGNIWFTESAANQIGRITPTGVITEFPIPTASSGPAGITTGPDGNIWFSERSANQIGRITFARAPAIDLRILPVVGSTPGVGGSFFRTSVQLHNSTGSAISGRIVFHPSGVAGGDSDPALFYSLAPGQTQSIADLLPALGRSGLGSADVVVTSGSAPTVTARVFNDAGAAGTTGFTEVVMRSEEAIGAGQHGVLLIPADLTNFRMNIGVRTLDATLMTLTVRDAAGAIAAVVPKFFPATYHEQQAASVFLNGLPLPPGGSITALIEAGSAIVYGATVDNRTGDPSLQIARAAP